MGTRVAYILLWMHKTYWSGTGSDDHKKVAQNALTFGYNILYYDVLYVF